MKSSCGWLIVAGLVAAGLTHVSARSQPQKPLPPLLTDSLAGRDLYDSYCASCHGREGKGDGPVGRALKTPPADLTTMARRHGGTYQAGLVEATLNGTRAQDPSGAHGTSEMPIWGSLFRQLDTKERTAKIRINSLVNYLEAIQIR